MKQLIKILFRKAINENNYQDNALDKLSQVGNFDNLPELYKLVLLAPSNDIQKLKKINLNKIYKENSGTFGRLQLKIRVKDVNEQPINHRFSKEFAGKEGFLYPYIHYSDNNEPYVTVRFKEFTSDPQLYGGGAYEERPIMLDNIYPIDYNDIDKEFVDYERKSDYERKEFKKGFEDLFNNDNDMD